MGDAIAGHLFYEIAALLVLAAAGGLVGVLLRQPLIVSYIAVGIVAGPSVLHVARSDDPIDLLAELGIALLLFLVGLKLDLKLVRTLGPVALMTGLGQVVFTTVFGFAIALALGLDPVTSLYAAVALTFSSTIIIVKLLSDKREIDSLHGRIALGFLIVQDLVVVLAMIVLSALGVGADAQDGAGIGAVALVLGYGALMLAAVALFVRYLGTPLTRRLAASPELLVSFAIGWAAMLAAVGHYLGFGKELGGLLAGIALASTPYREAIAARLAPLRDFLLLFFFIALGASLDLGTLGASVPAALVFSAFVLIGNPLIVLVIMRFMGYDRRTGFLAGLTVAQISEFSLIFMAMGVGLGHVGAQSLGLVTLVGLITIAASTYMITYSHGLYRILEPLLRPFDRIGRAPRDLRAAVPDRPYDVIVFGLGRYGFALAADLEAGGRRVLGVDFDPDAVRHARAHGVDAVFGDSGDPEFLGHLPLGGVAWAVSALPGHETGLTHDDPRWILVRTLGELGFKGRIAVAGYADRALDALRAEGVDLTLRPFRDAAAQAASLILADRAAGPPERTDPDAQQELVT